MARRPDPERWVEHYRRRAEQGLPLFEGGGPPDALGAERPQAPGEAEPPVPSPKPPAFAPGPAPGADLLSPKQLCQFLGITRRTLTRMIATGELPRPIRFNQRLLRWPPETIRAWLAALAGEEKNPYRDGTPRPH